MVWRFVASAWMLGSLVTGCGSGDPEGDPDPGTSQTGCAPGELALDGGGCQPAGLPPDLPCAPGGLELEGGGCQPAGLPPDLPCPPGEVERGGGCQPAGIPPGACGIGFVHDGDIGCEPILPAQQCPPGLIAVPGDATCREVAPCGSGVWGNIPLEATTQFVDASYPAADSDGSQQKPWTTIQAGIDAAAPGAVVAVAAGTYPEAVAIDGKPVRLWGRCPAQVLITGASMLATLDVRAADAAEVRNVAITGPHRGLVITGSAGVVVDSVRIHDNADRGMQVLAPAEVTLRAALIEDNRDVGIAVFGGTLMVDSTVIRDTLWDIDIVNFGYGMQVSAFPSGSDGASATVRSSVIQHNHHHGVAVFGSDITMDSTVVRDSRPEIPTGGGLGIQPSYPNGERRSHANIVGSLIELNHYAGVSAFGSDLTIEATVVRDTQFGPGPFALEGRGVSVQPDPTTGQPSSFTLRSSLIEKNRQLGVAVIGSTATLDGVAVRDTLPDMQGAYGRGLEVDADAMTGLRASLTMTGCAIDNNHDVGFQVVGSDALVETTRVADTRRDAQALWALGAAFTEYPLVGERASVSLSASLVERSHGYGVWVARSDATMDSVVVRDTQSDAMGLGGHGVLVNEAGTSVTLRLALVEGNRETGVSIAGADAILDGSVVRDTLPNAQDLFGAGVVVQPMSGARGSLRLERSVVEGNHSSGVALSGSDATLYAVIVRDTAANAQQPTAVGVNVQDAASTGDPASLTLQHAVIERNHGFGVSVVRSPVLVEATVIQDTLVGDDGLFGDGIAVFGGSASATTVVTSNRIDQSARAAIANFGAMVRIGTSMLRCQPIDLDGEMFLGSSYYFEDAGGNLCGCPVADQACKAVSTTLSPPEPLDPPAVRSVQVNVLGPLLP